MKHEKQHFTHLSYSLSLPFTALEGKKLSNLQELETNYGKPQFWFWMQSRKSCILIKIPLPNLILKPNKKFYFKKSDE